jgi:hypothetical protein
MFEKFGYFVQKLHRAKYGNVPIGNIKIGTWRYLETKEINDLKNLLNKEIRENRENNNEAGVSEKEPNKTE